MADINKTTKTTASATTTTTTSVNRLFRVQKPNPDEYKKMSLKTSKSAQTLSAYNYIVDFADIQKLQNYIAVRTPKDNKIESAINGLINTVRFNPFGKEWVDGNFRYGIISKDAVSRIKRIFNAEKNRMLLNIPYFYTYGYYENRIYGFYIRINGDIKFPLFGTDSAERLSLFFPEGNTIKIGNASIEALPMEDDLDVNAIISAYSFPSIEEWNEEMIKKTILRAIEESFEDDEYI